MPTKKNRLPRVVVGSRTVTAFDRMTMENICTQIAAGKSVREVMKDSRYSISEHTLFQWVDLFPEAAEMLAKARLVGSFAFEARAIEMLGRLERGEVSKDQIRAIDVALSHARWCMGKWNPQVFSDAVKPTPTVAIQINTNALGSEAVPSLSQSFTVDVPVLEDS